WAASFSPGNALGSAGGLSPAGSLSVPPVFGSGLLLELQANASRETATNDQPLSVLMTKVPPGSPVGTRQPGAAYSVEIRAELERARPVRRNRRTHLAAGFLRRDESARHRSSEGDGARECASLSPGRGRSRSWLS